VPPERLADPAAFRLACDAARARGARVGFVPTMGALHEGHLALAREARRRADWVAVSIFVNPTQFGPGEDFERYPRDLDGDVAKLADAGVDAVFCPDRAAMYPPGDATRVRVEPLARWLCGPLRPGHFEGVATVVAKLFALAGPCAAVFGRKDYQQLQVIRRLAADLWLPVEVVGAPTVREPDGLAMSSRNAYLSPDGRARARALARGLGDCHRLFSAGERGAGALRRAALAPVEAAADAVDYVAVADADSLEPFADGDLVPGRALVAVAARVGATRLIDNLVLGEDPPPAGGAS
jgi:pantoate--beta-alanine ligase